MPQLDFSLFFQSNLLLLLFCGIILGLIYVLIPILRLLETYNKVSEENYSILYRNTVIFKLEDHTQSVKKFHLMVF